MPKEVSDYYQKLAIMLGKRISAEMKQKNIDQTTLAEQVQQSQSAISHIISGKTNISMKKVFQVMEALDMDPLEEIACCARKEEKAPDDMDMIFNEIAAHASENLIIDPESPLFNGQTGNFYFCFLSTNTNEDKYLHGTMRLSSIGNRCVAELELLSKEKNSPEDSERKIYNGYAFLSPIQQAIYVILLNSSIGEICFLAYPYTRILSADSVLECTMALVVTVSSGIDSRLPTTHRMFLSRTPLDTKAEEQLRGQLLMNKSLIQISRGNFHKMIHEKNISQEFIQCFNHHKTEKVYYEIDEDNFKELAKEDIEYFYDLCMLRKYSSSPKNNKINNGVIGKIYRKVLWSTGNTGEQT